MERRAVEEKGIIIERRSVEWKEDGDAASCLFQSDWNKWLRRQIQSNTDVTSKCKNNCIYPVLGYSSCVS